MKMNTDERLREEIRDAVSIAFDFCHKIYLLMDEAQHDQMVTYGYGQDGDGSKLIRIEQTREGRARALETLREWWEDSCMLRFIETVRTVEGDPNKGFDHVIGQGDEWDDD